MRVLFLNPIRRTEFIRFFEKIPNVVIVIACHDENDYLMNCNYERYKISKPLDCQEVIKLCIEHSIDIIIPWQDSDIESLIDSMEIFKKNNVKLCIGDSVGTKIALSKEKCSEFLRKELGDIVLKAEAWSEYESWEYPVVVKPIYGSGSVGVKCIKNPRELEFMNFEKEKYMVQKYLSGAEFTVDIFCTNGKLIVAVPRKRIKFRAGEVLISQTICREDIIQKTEEICKVLKLDGVVNIQFMEDEQGNIYCTDVNPRYSGGCAISIYAGFNIPKFLIQYYGYNQIPKKENTLIWGLMGTRWLQTSVFHGCEEVKLKYRDYGIDV